MAARATAYLGGGERDLFLAVLKRISAPLVDIQRNGNGGIGKPEALKHDFAGYWSRRGRDGVG